MASAANSTDIDDPATFTHRFADVNGIRLHYVEEGEGPLVIMVHGFPFLWYLWRHQIRSVAAAGYRVVALDTRGYGQSGRPDAVSEYDMTRLVGDIVGLMKALDERSAVLVGQDWGSPIIFHAALMRPDLFRGLVMLCAPPTARPPISPAAAWDRVYGDINFYQKYFMTSEAESEITKDLRAFLLGVFYSTSARCPTDEQWRWAWRRSEQFSDTLTIPEELPDFLSRQALDYYTENFERTGIAPALNYYRAIQRNWEITSYLDDAVVSCPAVFAYGENDPSIRPIFGIDRQGPALRALDEIIPKLQNVIQMPGVGHTPPEEQPADTTRIILNFLSTL
ncbi:alpha/beta hydrolase [Nocardia cyriacigeorgica]|uniref:Alpha/beta hydrolase n=1 Tax=Nocardia cyriacigeorgica TaxID=135487 RepID=A0ABX0CHG0_9NOCA|nr:alpha/beta hydrolase [Nocardia cyriacigeorgica]NEW37645.1 alpha/beta hydrolase [Nocardia cyriacigeorgica]NEW48967.1 alpha/beta hydrolase [Nocardia cyriacigeorgica]NEW55068.1 alpha/beta hydrolase [Nocardia cyriacigeorgica]